jgi:hypothetical protein
MKKKILSLLAVVASLAIFACSSDEAETADLQGGLNLLVKDANSGQAVAAVSATLLSNGQTKMTDAQGAVSFSGISGGSHTLRIEKEGYATLKGVIPVPIIGFYNQEVPLYALSTLTGSLYYQDNNGALKPAAGATVRVTLPDNFHLENNVIEVEVGADGKYTLLNMPAVGDYAVIALEHTIDGVSYGPTTICTICPNLALGDNINKLTDRTYSKSTLGVTFRLLESVIELADSTQPVVLHFTDSIDIAKSSRIQVASGDYGSEITYSIDHKTVTITPLGGKWMVAPTITSTSIVSGKGQTISSIYVSTSVKTPKIDLSKEFVKNVTITEKAHPETGITLQWNKVVGADVYVIYAKASKGTNRYEAIDYVFPSSPGDVESLVINWSTYISELGSSIYGGDVMFVVQAFNYASETETLLNDVIPAKVDIPNLTVAGEPITVVIADIDADGWDDDGITLAWNAVPGATKYQIWQRVNSIDTKLLDTPTPENSFKLIFGEHFDPDDAIAPSTIGFFVKAVGFTADDISTNPSNVVTFPPSVAGMQVNSVGFSEDGETDGCSLSAYYCQLRIGAVTGAKGYTVIGKVVEDDGYGNETQSPITINSSSWGDPTVYEFYPYDNYNSNVVRFEFTVTPIGFGSSNTGSAATFNLQ